MIPPQISLQELKNLILMHTGMVGKKEIRKLTYRIPVAVANSFSYQKMQIKSDQHVSMMFSYHRSIGSIYSLELCLNLQDIGGSSSSSNNVEGVRNRGAADFVLARDTSRAPSPSFNAFVPWEQSVGIRGARPAPSTHVGVDMVLDAAIADTSDEDDIEDFSDGEAEAVPETQPLHGDAVPATRVEPEGGGVSSSTPAHYLSLNLGAMHSSNAEDGPSSYPLSGEMELEIGLKFPNRETAMLAVKNYNIRRSAEYKVVESDQSRYVCRCKQFGDQCRWMVSGHAMHRGWTETSLFSESTTYSNPGWNAMYLHDQSAAGMHPCAGWPIPQTTRIVEPATIRHHYEPIVDGRYLY
ncbi:hypothetical protein Ahy_B05g079486 [Arachis hypogaea]|uniref:Transposase MuDR plant domain-containing protein n=1 Tax=Arachis hypogaea TaxID=3818 RepID=A0A444Z9Y2_ARAHY|nr:hypothetical protein Ahy_B05g079486 [Arachis hypogaea]